MKRRRRKRKNKNRSKKKGAKNTMDSKVFPCYFGGLLNWQLWELTFRYKFATLVGTASRRSGKANLSTLYHLCYYYSSGEMNGYTWPWCRKEKAQRKPNSRCTTGQPNYMYVKHTYTHILVLPFWVVNRWHVMDVDSKRLRALISSTTSPWYILTKPQIHTEDTECKYILPFTPGCSDVYYASVINYPLVPLLVSAMLLDVACVLLASVFNNKIVWVVAICQKTLMAALFSNGYRIFLYLFFFFSSHRGSCVATGFCHHNKNVLPLLEKRSERR